MAKSSSSLVIIILVLILGIYVESLYIIGGGRSPLFQSPSRLRSPLAQGTLAQGTLAQRLALLRGEPQIEEEDTWKVIDELQTLGMQGYDTVLNLSGQIADVIVDMLKTLGNQ